MHTYDVISESVRNPHELAAELTRRSEQGWEVVHIVYDGAAWFHAFIRHEGRVSVAPFAGASDIATSAGAMASPTSAADAVSRVAPASPAAIAPSSVAQPAVAQPAAQVTTPVTSTTPSPTVGAGSVPDVPANWYKDPSGRYELRYWNGTAWTEHVATGGRQSVDPPRS